MVKIQVEVGLTTATDNGSAKFKLTLALQLVPMLAELRVIMLVPMFQQLAYPFQSPLDYPWDSSWEVVWEVVWVPMFLLWDS